MYPYNNYYSYSSAAGMSLLVSLIVFLLSIGGGLYLYFVFLSDKNEGKYEGIYRKIYDFLKFKIMISAELLKVIYLISMVGITLMGIFSLTNVVLGLFMIVFGNIFLRIGYEAVLLFFSVHSNLVQINDKLGKPVEKVEKKEGKKTEEK